MNALPRIGVCASCKRTSALAPDSLVCDGCKAAATTPRCPKCRRLLMVGGGCYWCDTTPEAA